MARRRKRRRKSSYSEQSGVTGPGSMLVMEDLSPRARRLVEGGVIDVSAIAGSGAGGKVTSGDILHAARLMEKEQSVARIETTVNNGVEHDVDAAPTPADSPLPDAEPGSDDTTGESNSATFGAADVGGEPIAVEPDPWDAYNGSSEGFADRARPGAEQSWGEAEANIAAMAEEAAEKGIQLPEDHYADVPVAASTESLDATLTPADVEPEAEPAVAQLVPVPEPGSEQSDLTAPAQQEQGEQVAPTEPAEAPQEPITEVMMDFGTLELVDPESVWAEGAEDFAPWFLAHSKQLGDVLGLESGLTDARQFTTKSATGVLGRDDRGDDVVVVSSKNAVADDSDLGRALGMAASSGAASVALVSAALGEDQLKALAWLNNQTKSGVKWYGIEMRVVRIADSPAAMLFDLVASPPAVPVPSEQPGA